MKTKLRQLVAAGALLAVAVTYPLMAQQEDVTISKSRLKELEAKEAELEKLKSQKEAPAKTQAPALMPPSAQTTLPAVNRQSPALASLPPLKDGDVVDACDLGSYYRQDHASADQRFRGRKIVVRGEILGFEKPILTRDYRVVLAGPDRDTRVTCSLAPPDKFNAVFPVNEGSQIVGLQGETRVPLAKVGDLVLVNGTCKGWKKSSVQVVGNDMKVAR